MNFLFRLPKFPVIVDTGDQLIVARTKAQLGSKLSKIERLDSRTADIIDAKAEGYSLYVEKMFVAPNIAARKWTKAKMIDLYNTRRGEGAPELRATSLGNRSLEQIVGEISDLLSRFPGK